MDSSIATTASRSPAVMRRYLGSVSSNALIGRSPLVALQRNLVADVHRASRLGGERPPLLELGNGEPCHFPRVRIHVGNNSRQAAGMAFLEGFPVYLEAAAAAGPRRHAGE